MSTGLDTLAADLRAALATLGAAVVEVVPVVGLGFPGYRQYAYRVELADGRSVKARCFQRSKECQRAEYVARCLGRQIVTQPLARVGVALVTEWAQGTAPPTTDAMLRRCGAMLARAHSTPLPPDAPSVPEPVLASRWQRLHGRAANLAEAGVLTGDEVTALLDIASRSAPSTLTVGFVLHDFTAQNIVVDAAGEPCLIDHDGLNISVLEFDVARTWYRWPLQAEQRRSLLAGYAAVRDIEPFLAHFPYWAVDVLVAAITFRLSRDVRGTEEPLGRLRGLIGVLRDGVAGRDAVTQC